ncbi:MAG: response regulator transcription factor [Bacteroidia bacterium]
MASPKKILVVDDEQDILEFLGYYLRKEGFQVFTANDGAEGIASAKKEIPDLIILDVMMPVMDGMETCRELRKEPFTKDITIAFLTARNEDYSQITGFDSGADDYITKPIKPSVLISRVKALLRRAEKFQPEENHEAGGITIDHERYTVTKDGEELQFPKKEFELLALLFSKPGKVFHREDILEKVWGNNVVVGDRTIDVHIRKLREKLGDDYIQTVKGIGYKFVF